MKNFLTAKDIYTQNKRYKRFIYNQYKLSRKKLYPILVDICEGYKDNKGQNINILWLMINHFTETPSEDFKISLSKIVSLQARVPVTDSLYHTIDRDHPTYVKYKNFSVDLLTFFSNNSFIELLVKTINRLGFKLVIDRADSMGYVEISLSIGDKSIKFMEL